MCCVSSRTVELRAGSGTVRAIASNMATFNAHGAPITVSEGWYMARASRGNCSECNRRIRPGARYYQRSWGRARFDRVTLCDTCGRERLMWDAMRQAGFQAR